MRRATIIGGGLAGLCVARELLRHGWSVRLLEAGPSTGGLCRDAFVAGHRVDQYYHHVFKAEHSVQALIRECGLMHRFHWRRVTQGRTKAAVPGREPSGKQVSICSLGRAALFGCHLLSRRESRLLDDRTALDWLNGFFLSAEIDELWVPLLRKKFGRYHADVSAWWLADRITARLSSGNLFTGTEVLGYLDGGFSALTDALERDVLVRGGVVERNVAVSGLGIKANRIESLMTERGEIACPGQVVSTIPRPMLASLDGFPAECAEEWPPYMACICPVLISRKTVSPHYWFSDVSDNPFCAVVEQSKLYRGNAFHVLYLPEYTESDPEPPQSRIVGAADIATSALPKAMPEFDARDVLASAVSFDRYCQPVFLLTHPLIPEGSLACAHGREAEDSAAPCAASS